MASPSAAPVQPPNNTGGWKIFRLWNWWTEERSKLLWVRKCYLDHNATTPPAPEVEKELTRAFHNVSGNPSSLHTMGREGRALIDAARNKIADLLGHELFLRQFFNF